MKYCTTCEGRTPRYGNGRCIPCKRAYDARRYSQRMRRSTPNGRTHLVGPDIQARPGVPLDHVHWFARYAVDRRPNVVVLLGDVYDMPSLSGWDKRGSKSTEGRRVAADFRAGDRVLEILDDYWTRHNYAPDEMHVVKGNHEHRRQRAIEADPHLLDGVMRDYAFEKYGWTTHAFLDPVEIDGVRYCHFFPHSASGAVTQSKRGAPSARAQVQRQMCSATAGHQQGLDVALIPTPSGLQRGLIAGSFYLHDEGYIGPGALNRYWRGVVVKHEVANGDYSLMEVSMDYLRRKYSSVCPSEVA